MNNCIIGWPSIHKRTKESPQAFIDTFKTLRLSYKIVWKIFAIQNINFKHVHR